MIDIFLFIFINILPIGILLIFLFSIID